MKINYQVLEKKININVKNAVVLKFVNIAELKQLVLIVKEVQYVNIIKEEYIV